MKWKKRTLCLAVPLAVGGLSWALTRQGIETSQNQTVHPLLTPPQWAFPVVWTALFLMMGLAGGIILPLPKSGGSADGALPAVGGLCGVSQLRHLAAELKKPPSDRRGGLFMIAFTRRLRSHRTAALFRPPVRRSPAAR